MRLVGVCVGVRFVCGRWLVGVCVCGGGCETQRDTER